MAEVDDYASALVTATAEDLLRYFRRRAASDDAADLLAETLTTAWKRVDVLPRDPTTARMWLFGIAHKTLLNHHRAQHRQLQLGQRLRSVLHTAGDGPAADVGIEVRDAIERLPPKLAEIVRLVHWEGFTLAQAAEIMQIPASTARNHYQRAKAALRTALLPQPAGAMRDSTRLEATECSAAD